MKSFKVKIGKVTPKQENNIYFYPNGEAHPVALLLKCLHTDWERLVIIGIEKDSDNELSLYSVSTDRPTILWDLERARDNLKDGDLNG